MSTLTAGTQGYSAGYDTSDYSGFLIKQDLDPVTGAPGATDLGCELLVDRRHVQCRRLHFAAAAASGRKHRSHDPDGE